MSEFDEYSWDPPTLPMHHISLLRHPAVLLPRSFIPGRREVNESTTVASDATSLDTGPEIVECGGKETSLTMVVKPDTYTEQQAKGLSVKNVDKILQVEEQFIETFEFEDGAHTNVKGNLKKNLKFWEAIGTSTFILDTIDEGYKLPFTELPNRVYLRNNKSAEAHRDFVNEAILDLVNSGRVRESITPPCAVNSLSVSVQSKAWFTLAA